MDRVSASIPARVCLGGEDLDWMGGETIVAAIDTRLNVVATRTNGNTIRIHSAAPFDISVDMPLNAIEWQTGGPLDHIAAAIRQLQTEFAIKSGFDISVSTEFPPAAGLSSSAAVILGTLASLCLLNGISIETPKLIQMAHKTEQNFLNTGAGMMDFEVCALGGLRIFSTDAVPYSREIDTPPLWFVIMDSGQRRSTGKAIRWKRERLLGGDGGIKRYHERTQILVTSMIKILSSHVLDANSLGREINTAQQVIREDLRVSTNVLDAACRLATEAGALGAKISGTGLGGCVVALVNSPSQGQRVVAEARNEGFDAFLTKTIQAGIILKASSDE